MTRPSAIAGGRTPGALDMIRAMVVFVAVAIPLPAAAQHATPYAGFEQRSIKALSTQQIDDLRQGRGMDLALAAELNGYPGPSHVIELADRLELTPAQLERARALFDAMKAETIPIGERLIAEEAQLDRLFVTRSITPESLNGAVAAIGSTNASLRAAHLKYHLAMLDVLTPTQTQLYSELRGYAGAPNPHSPGGHRPHH
jgi:Spy/CpxP family protein refolding chaperone